MPIYRSIYGTEMGGIFSVQFPFCPFPKLLSLLILSLYNVYLLMAPTVQSTLKTRVICHKLCDPSLWSSLGAGRVQMLIY